MLTEERRKHKRIQGDIALSINDTQSNLISESLDISVSGVSCKVHQKMVLMSNVILTLMLPSVGFKGKKTVNKIVCQGVVVRVERIKGEPSYYTTVIFFADIKKQGRKALEKYVNYVELEKN